MLLDKLIDVLLNSGKTVMFFNKGFTMVKITLLISLILSFLGCSNNNIVPNPITGKKSNPGIFSRDAEKGISLSDILSPTGEGRDNININGYLWRASLNILSIAPLISTDALGGTIITDWYTAENNMRERCKLNIFVKGADLKTDNLKVSSFCQSLEKNQWVNKPIIKEDNIRLENVILNKAKKLKLTSG